ncbi:protein of unknown function [Pseudobutyrivibrio ruminis]|uniref:DUF4422 domain-containing protein n=1 Tax=Pseudobutyrivibrio ruminis TaxID=46206 RepID=A0A1H7JAA8_9FIRM|nr:DUF4422 domain-containing protein [Pseudobutyrivibrio ruminis]SEK70807.1 protein of unknown function [Pseudobutyrivibrio ruminis]
MPKIYIAGAHSRAITTGYYLKYIDPSIEIVAYLYDNDENNPTEVEGVPVLKIDENSKLDVETVVYLGMRGINQEHITHTLQKCGVKHIIPVDVKLDMDLRNRYLTQYFAEHNRKYDKIYNYDTEEDASMIVDKRQATVYVANSAFDKPLNTPYRLNDNEKIIQVGAALTNDRIAASYFDSTGDNISEKNKQFCELTALYWIWKNAKDDMVGLVHYRRHFILPENWKQIMAREKIDVVLPVPLYVHPSLEANYRDRHVESNWDNMLEYFKVNRPDEFQNLNSFFKETGLYSPCNMLIARKDVFDELCEWLFPVLFDVADKGGTLDDAYQNRYPGFISERLITYFFEKNRDRFKVVYADKNFLK